MRIQSVDVKNLRCIKDSVAQLNPYTCLVGPNGAGKSTLLLALNVFFREVENAPTNVTLLTSKDFYMGNITSPIEITVTFTDLSEEAKQDFKDYVRQDRLTITAMATFDTQSGSAEVKQYGQRLGMKAFMPFFKAYGDGAPASELKAIFEGLEKGIPDLAAKASKKTKDAMSETLQNFESERPNQCELIPSEDQFYGFSKGTNRLQKYVQWIFIPAVKDATDEQLETKTGALGKLLARTVRAKVNFSKAVNTLLEEARQQYQKILDDNETALSDISKALTKRLAEWAHPGATLRISWQQDSSKAVRADLPLASVVAGESGFEGDLVRFGHGFQRSYLLALLQELATGDDKTAPTLILACEEPELYQHPPQARHLAAVLESLSQNNAQILVTTHSPYFVTGKNFESVRLVRRSLADNCVSIRQYSYAETAARFAEVVGEPLKTQSAALSKVHQALQPSLNEMFFTQRLVLVEGLEDVAYVHSWLVLTERWEKYRRCGCHIVPVDGKSEMIRPAIIAQGLGIPYLQLQMRTAIR
jgi:putative ATP-dependent endonuclease of the OLD family